MKKTISDLKINDKVYFLNDNESTEISITKINLISHNEIITTHGHNGNLDEKDFTAWQFEARYSRDVTFYLNREDLLSKILANAKKKLESSIYAQSKIVLKLLDDQKLVSKIESEIENNKKP